MSLRRRGVRWLGALLVCAAAATLLLPACGGEGSSSQGPTPKPGGTFVFPLLGDPVSIEPLNAQETEGTQVAHQVFQGLVKYVTNDSGEMVAVPDIAETWETGDGRVWTFHLKPGVRFQRPVGRAVVAQDFVDSWNRATDPANESYVSYVLAPIEGCDDRGYQVDTSAGLTGVTAVDAHTLRVALRYPFAEFPETLGHTVAAVTPVDYIERVGARKFARRPIGTGPYKVVSWKRGKSITLARNADYWQPAAAGHVDKIKMPIVADVETMWDAFEDGEIDCSRVPPGQVATVTASPRVQSGRWSATSWPTLALGYVGIDMKGGRLSRDLDLRLALAMATDKQRVVSEAGEGVPTPASGYVPEGVPGRRSNDDLLPFDPSRAKSVVDGLASVPELDYWYANSDAGEEVARILRAGWREAGVEVRARGFEWPVLYSGLSQTGSSESPDLFATGFIADYPSMGAFLYPLFHSDQSGTGSLTGYSSPQVDEVLLQARGTLDAQQRQNLYAQAERLILADMPAVPLYYYRAFRVSSARIGGFTLNPMGLTDMWAVWVK